MATRLLGAKLNLLSARDVLNARDKELSDYHALCAAASIRCVVAAGDSRGGESLTLHRSRANSAPHYLSLANARSFVAKLVAPADGLIKPLLPDLYEPVLTNIGNGLLVLRGFARLDDSATVREGRCEVLTPADSDFLAAVSGGDGDTSVRECFRLTLLTVEKRTFWIRATLCASIRA